MFFIGLMTDSFLRMTNEAKTGNNPIDVVISWVDGNDPDHQEKMHPFLDNRVREDIPGAHPTRFRSVNEIRYCVLSIFTFAPFVRKVFVVTDAQDPNLQDDIKQYFPERLQTLRVIDHKHVFKGYEHYLPTFSSRAIESMIWRIDGLSDRFIYFNDDSFLIRSTKVSDFFIQNRPVLRGGWLPSPWPRTLWAAFQTLIKKKLMGKKDFQPKPSYHLGQWLAAKKAGFRFRYFYFNHTPYSISKTTAQNFYDQDPRFFDGHLKHRFKNHKQINFISLLYHLELKNGNKYIRKPDVAYVNPTGRMEGYIDRKIELCMRDEKIKFLCVQSMDLCNKGDQDKVFNWLEDLFQKARGGTICKKIGTI